MIKIYLSVRNRLAITKKCIAALNKHSTLPHQIYVYDNQTNYKIAEHFTYFYKMYTKGVISQVTFTTDSSNFNAFSKATTFNIFGRQHEEDPKKDNYDFLMVLDNDIIVMPNWDKNIKVAWDYVNKNKMNNIKVIGQIPGGIKQKDQTKHKFNDIDGVVGHLGGSGLWSIRPNFFREVGFLDLKQLVGQSKRHDQLYWQKLAKSTNNNPYIMGVKQKLGIHCGKIAGSICNQLTSLRNDPKKLEKINFEEAEKMIDDMDFETFYKMIENDKKLIGDW